MVYHQRIGVLGLGLLEGLLGRHWPEATRVLKLSSATLLQMRARYGGPGALAADEGAASRWQRWGGALLKADKVRALLDSARSTVGVRQGEWEQRRLKEQAEPTRAARREVGRCKRQLRRLAQGQAALQAQGQMVGVATACVLWYCLGDPQQYHCAAAYRKAMGLNLVERSSGTYQGQLKISKRGHAWSRQWLYLATLRLVKEVEVQRWYQAKKARDPLGARRAVVAVMRKLALALYHVGISGTPFEARRLFERIGSKKAAQPASGPGSDGGDG
jgi:hypothetical protein